MAFERLHPRSRQEPGDVWAEVRVINSPVALIHLFPPQDNKVLGMKDCLILLYHQHGACYLVDISESFAE